SNKLYQFWKSMIESSELFYWQNWEDFNIRFLALKFCLLSVYGYKEINGCDFLKGAYCGDMLKDIIIKIPEWNTILLIKEKSLAVYKNGESAPFDGFSYIQLKTTNSKDVIMACLQAKWRKLETAQPQKITDSMIKKEYDSTKKALADNLTNDDFIFVLLSICPLSNEIDNPSTLLKDFKNAALICKNNFRTFYGFTYATRAHLAAEQEKVNINTADIWELRLIKGVGEQLADDISLMRKRKRFDNEDDLCKRTKFPKLAVSSVMFK
ncbi:14604_t:CDS:2, partial [Funneliformis caledonium]